ncbi:MAG: hypothetical protein WAN92_09200 [Herbaspirillum sp.]
MMRFSWEWGNPLKVLERKQEMSMARQRIEIPQDLKDADELLDKFGRWAQDRHRKQTCASAERLYKRPDNWGDEGKPEPLMPDFRAMDVHRALLRVPLRYRRILFAHYIPQRLPPEAQRRRMGIPGRVWDVDHVAGLRMFWNNWQLHYACKI